MKEGLTLEYNYLAKQLKKNLVKSLQDVLERFLSLLSAPYKLIELDTLTAKVSKCGPQPHRNISVAATATTASGRDCRLHRLQYGRIGPRRS